MQRKIKNMPLNCSKNNSMSNFTPPHVANRGWDLVNRIFLILFIAYCACDVVWHGYQAGVREQEYVAPGILKPYVPNCVYYNRDSLLYYAHLAYTEEEPVALCITGVSSYLLNIFDPAASDSLTAVPLDEADIMLLRSSELGCEAACLFIYYFKQRGIWKHALPDCNYDSLFNQYEVVTSNLDGLTPLKVKTYR